MPLTTEDNLTTDFYGDEKHTGRTPCAFICKQITNKSGLVLANLKIGMRTGSDQVDQQLFAFCGTFAILLVTRRIEHIILCHVPNSNDIHPSCDRPLRHPPFRWQPPCETPPKFDSMKDQARLFAAHLVHDTLSSPSLPSLPSPQIIPHSPRHPQFAPRSSVVSCQRSVTSKPLFVSIHSPSVSSFSLARFSTALPASAAPQPDARAGEPTDQPSQTAEKLHQGLKRIAICFNDRRSTCPSRICVPMVSARRTACRSVHHLRARRKSTTERTVGRASRWDGERLTLNAASS